MSDYKFNKDKLDFTENKRGLRHYIKYVITYLFFSFFLAFIYYFIFSSFFDSPTHKSIVRENDKMTKEYAKITAKMILLDSVIVDLRNRDVLIYQGMFRSKPFMLGDLDSLTTFYSVKDLNLFADKLKERVDSIMKLLDEGKDNLRYIPSIPPIENFLPSQVSASIGQKVNPFYKIPYNHNGLDIVVGVGVNVLAPADGVVKSVQRAYKESGNLIIISHGKDYITKYAHLGDILVRKGRKVKRGDIIARVGNTGISFAPHLHYEIWYKGEVVDPSFYFFQKVGTKEFFEILMHVSNSHQSLD